MMRAIYVALFATLLSSSVGSRWLHVTELRDIHKNGYAMGANWEEVDKFLSVLVDREKFQSTEDKLLKSLETTKNIYADPLMKNGLTTMAIGTSLIPVVGQIFGIITSIAGLLEEETDWKDEFTKVIVDEMK